MTNIELTVYGVREESDGGLKGLGEDQFHTHYQFTAPASDLRRMKEMLNSQPGPEIDFPTYVIDLEEQVLDASEDRYSEIDSTRPPRRLSVRSAEEIELAA